MPAIGINLFLELTTDTVLFSELHTTTINGSFIILILINSLLSTISCCIINVKKIVKPVTLLTLIRCRFSPH